MIHARHLITMLAITVVMLSGCASGPIAPSDEERQSLIPTGTLRVAFLADSAPHASLEPTTGKLKGPAIDLGEALARRLGTAFEARPYPTVAALVKSIDSGEWDVISTGRNAELEHKLSFAPAHARISIGYLVRTDAPIGSIDEVDRPGVRIVVLERGNSDVLLTKSIRRATLIRTNTGNAALEMLRSGKADAHPNLKTVLFDAVTKTQNVRLLDGAFHVQPIALAVVSEHAAGGRYLTKFVEESKTSGFVQRSIERTNLPGLEAAP